MKKQQLVQIIKEEIKGMLKETAFDYEWGVGFTVGGDNPSDLTFYLDKKTKKICYSYKNVTGILKDADKKDLVNFFNQHP